MAVTLSTSGSALQGALDPGLTGAPASHFENEPRATIPEALHMELQRSATIVIWYQAGKDPIMLQQSISSFPLFHFLGCPILVKELGLTPHSYLDTYVPAQSTWEQHTISSVRRVDSNQRLLYRIRKSLFDGLKDEDCPRLQEEVQRQHQPRKSSPPVDFSKKRPAPDNLENPPPSKYRISTSTPATTSATLSHNTSPTTFTQTPAPPLTPAATPTNSPIYDYVSPSAPTAHFSTSPVTPATVLVSPLPPPPAPFIHPSSTISQLVSAALEVPIPHHPHPPLKRWPNDYTVVAISTGFVVMDILCSSSYSMSTPTTTITTVDPLTGAENAHSTQMTQKVAFERVFGTRYIKSTVCRHRGIWKRAPAELRTEFAALDEHDERGQWPEFVRRVEGRSTPKKSAKEGT